MPADLPPLILASASPRRAALLGEMGLEFATVPAHAPEIAPDHLTPTEAALINAHRKARLVAKKHPDALVLGADTIVALGRTMYGKPADQHDAARMLAELQGHTHQVITGVCLIHLRAHRERMFAAITHVTFRRLRAHEIDSYLKQIHPLDKAGAYAIQDHGDAIVERIVGSFSNVVGLPVERLRSELDRWPG